jgi:ribosome-binding factor A
VCSVRAREFPTIKVSIISMTIRKISRAELAASCSHPWPEDGIDPKRQQRSQGPKPPKRKALQLCAQVARTVAAVLSGESGDDVLRDLVVEAVVPAPSSARLLVTVALCHSADAEALRVVAERLEHARGRLRTEVAATIRRRRAPDLVFRLVTPS